MGSILPVRTQTDTDKSAAAVPYHDSNCQGHHGQGEYHGVGRISVGPKIACIGNENLVHNVVQGCHQQGNNAGDCVLSHQGADWLCFKKGVGFLVHWTLLLNKKIKA